MSPVNQWDQRVIGTRNLAATAATIAVVGLGVVTEPAFAAESGVHAMSRQEANDLVFTRDEARKQVDPGAVTYYSKEFGTSRKEAIQRLTTQGVAPNLQAPLGKALGDDLSGLFFDNESGEWVVQVADKEASPRRRASSTVSVSTGTRVSTGSATRKAMSSEPNRSSEGS